MSEPIYDANTQLQLEKIEIFKQLAENKKAIEEVKSLNDKLHEAVKEWRFKVQQLDLRFENMLKYLEEEKVKKVETPKLPPSNESRWELIKKLFNGR